VTEEGEEMNGRESEERGRKRNEMNKGECKIFIIVSGGDGTEKMVHCLR